jgi:hypothetical protein
MKTISLKTTRLIKLLSILALMIIISMYDGPFMGLTIIIPILFYVSLSAKMFRSISIISGLIVLVLPIAVYIYDKDGYNAFGFIYLLLYVVPLQILATLVARTISDVIRLLKK